MIRLNRADREEERLTEAIFDEVIESVTIAIVSKFVIRRRKLLKALSSDGSEIAFEFGILGENHRSTSDEAVDQILLSHLCPEEEEEEETNPNALQIRI